MSVQCCACSKWVHLMCSLLSFSRFRTLSSSHSWSCSPCCVPAFFGDPTPTSTVTSSLDSSSLYTSTAQSGSSGPFLLMQHSRPTRLTLASKPLILFRPLCISCFLFFSLTPSGFFDEMLGVSEPGALNCYTLFRLIQLTLFVSRKRTLTYLTLS